VFAKSTPATIVAGMASAGALTATATRSAEADRADEEPGVVARVRDPSDAGTACVPPSAGAVRSTATAGRHAAAPSWRATICRFDVHQSRWCTSSTA
jgi:hypothetical protein